MTILRDARKLSQSLAEASDGFMSDLRASVDSHAQEKVDLQRKNLTMSEELSEWKGMYHALVERADSEEKMDLQIEELKVDSDDV